MNIRKKFIFQQAMSITSRAKTKNRGSQGETLAKVATKQLQSRKNVEQKYRDIACKANFFPSLLEAGR